MAAWTPYLLIYLAGIATPIILIRQLLRARGDDGACLLEAALMLIGVLFLAVLAMGLFE